MRFRTGILALLVIAAALTLNMPLPQAQATDQAQIDKTTQERNELEQQLNNQKSRSRNLSEEVSYMNNQIRLQELEIQNTQGQIQSLQTAIVQANSQIQNISDKLARLEDSMEQTQQAANARLRESYKKSRTSSLATIITSADFQAMLRSMEYLQRTKEEDTRILADMAETKKSYQTEKSNLEKVKVERTKSQNQLLAKQNEVQSKQQQLESSKAAQSNLLAKSKEDESYYSTLLAQKEAELRAYASAVAAPGQQSFYVLRGQVIAYQGNTGCSTGSHLHFGYRKVNLGTSLGGWQNAITSGKWIDPLPYINNGTLGKPLSSYSISQYFGQNAAGIVDYGSDGHPAVDIYSYYGAPIYAAESGWAQRMTDSGCGTGPGKGIIITHANGSGQTLYWHIQ